MSIFEINARNTSYFRIMTNGAALIACGAIYLLQPVSENPLIINSLLLLSSVASIHNLCEAATATNNNTTTQQRSAQLR